MIRNKVNAKEEKVKKGDEKKKKKRKKEKENVKDIIDYQDR